MARWRRGESFPATHRRLLATRINIAPSRVDATRCCGSIAICRHAAWRVQLGIWRARISGGAARQKHGKRGSAALCAGDSACA